MTKVRRSPRAAELRFDEPDDAIAALAPETREHIATIVEKRARSEIRIAGTFAAISRELLATGAEPAVLGIAMDAVAEEVAHGRVWLRLAEKYRGQAVTDPQPAPVGLDLPQHPGATAELRATLHVVALCCINETVAAARLEALLAVSPAPSMRATLRAVLEDEVDHARMGWAHLSSKWVSDADRRALSNALAPLLEANIGAVRGSFEAELTEGVEGHGILAGKDMLAVDAAAVRELVLPGFAHVGVDTSVAEQWLAKRHA